MKNPDSIILSIVFIAFLAVNVEAQTYKTAVGARLGYPLSASFKTFISESSAIEVYAGFRGWSTYSWITVSGAYLIHKPFPSVENLQWYFGGGASVYFWNYKSSFGIGGDNTSFGIQGYLGLDYKIENAPVNLTVDWVPTFFLNGYGSGFGGGYGSLGIRYVLK
jgi:hypothetical protein